MDVVRVAVVNWTRLEAPDLLAGIEVLREQLDDYGQGAMKFVPLVEPRRDETRPGCLGLVLLGGPGPLNDDQHDAREAPQYLDGVTSDGEPLVTVSLDGLDDLRDWPERAGPALRELLGPQPASSISSHRGTWPP
jgi:hypothetical protein